MMDEIDLHKFGPKVRAELEKIGLLSCRRIIKTVSHEFRKLGDFTDDEILKIKATASKKIIPRGFASALDGLEYYKNEWRNVTFNCQTIDKITGGLPTRGITEICGESGTGKTQLCLQLCLTVQFTEENRGLGRGALYICTDKEFSATRLSQMASFFPKKNGNFMDGVIVNYISDLEMFQTFMFNRLPHLMQSTNIGLIVIDSIAALFRSCNSWAEFSEQAKGLRAIGVQLHYLSRAFNIAIVSTNKVAEAADMDETVPNLRLVWANLITIKLMLVKLNEETKMLKVVAPHLPSERCLYKITEKGVEGVEVYRNNSRRSQKLTKIRF